MFSKTAGYYDAIYRQFKDYRSEAAKIAAILGYPDCGEIDVLDAACGTGRHARFLNGEFGFRVDGLDIEPEFVKIAQKAAPGCGFFVGDMRDFDLGTRYHGVICLFSAIGYMGSYGELENAISCFSRHLLPGGRVIVEPWLTPEDFKPGQLNLQTVDEDDLKLARLSVGALEGITSRFTFEYLIADSDGIRHETEKHDLTLFTVEEMMSAFESCGLAAEYEPVGLTGRGLYVAQ